MVPTGASYSTAAPLSKRHVVAWGTGCQAPSYSPQSKPVPPAALCCTPLPRRLRADAAEAMRTANRRVAEVEARAAALNGDVGALTAELGQRPTVQDAA